MSQGDLALRPDAAALALVAQVYASFGFFPEQLPAEFDRGRGVLVLGG